MKPAQIRLVARPPATRPNALPDDLHPVLERVYASRSICDASDLDQSLSALLSWQALGGIHEAAELLADALSRRRRIIIIGDFDADGATSSALAVIGLRQLGAAEVGYLVPNRFEFGYGLTPEIVELAARARPDLLVTVDNGISSIEGVAAARAAGIDVLVTDHHLAGAALPDANAIVNPNLPGDAFASKALAGCGVMFYVLVALRARLRDGGWFEATGRVEPRLADLLDLVALGTVADVVPLDRNNRILVEQGLRRIRAGRCRPGVLALLEVGGCDASRAVAADIGFAVGPRLNAAGRLTDMSAGIECLLTDDAAAARRMAGELDRLNRERKEIESVMQEEALAVLSELRVDDEDTGLPWGLCLYDAGWHQGVTGILAARMRERTHRPVIAFAPSGENEIKGSARSVPGLHVRDVLDAVAAHNPGLVRRFGGHAMAAGLSLREGDYDAFALAFDNEVRARMDERDLVGELLTDGELRGDEMTLELAELLRSAGPWGQGFPEPLFEGEFGVTGARVVGARHLKLSLAADGHAPMPAIAFNIGDLERAPRGGRVRAAYRLDVNEYRGQRELQLRIEHIETLAWG